MSSVAWIQFEKKTVFLDDRKKVGLNSLEYENNTTCFFFFLSKRFPNVPENYSFFPSEELGPQLVASTLGVIKTATIVASNLAQRL